MSEGRLLLIDFLYEKFGITLLIISLYQIILYNVIFQNFRNNEIFEQSPASEVFINSLKDIKITKQNEIKEDDECTICLKIFEINDILHKLPCEHKFHKNCIIEWLKKINSCPLCRKEFPKRLVPDIHFSTPIPISICRWISDRN